MGGQGGQLTTQNFSPSVHCDVIMTSLLPYTDHPKEICRLPPCFKIHTTLDNKDLCSLEICLLTTPPFAIGKDGEVDPITGEVMNTVKVINLDAGEASDLLVEFQANFTGVRHSR